MLTKYDFTSEGAYIQYHQETMMMMNTIDDLVARLNPCVAADPNDETEYDDDCLPIVK